MQGIEEEADKTSGTYTEEAVFSLVRVAGQIVPNRPANWYQRWHKIGAANTFRQLLVVDGAPRRVHMQAAGD